MKLNCIWLTQNAFVIYIYSLIYFFQIYINFFFNIWKLIYVSNIMIIHSYASYYLKTILSYFFRLLFIKLRFIGKGYKLLIRKNSLHNIILFNFGYSHRYYIYIYFFYMLQTAKTKFIFFGLNYFLLKIVLQRLYLIKPLNIFTLRGLRFAKQCILKKIGKIGLYM
jgi:hypothetical protein